MSGLYPQETLGSEDDDGTMVSNVAALSEAVVGHRIVNVEKGAQVRPDDDSYHWHGNTGTVITLDNGVKVGLINTDRRGGHADSVSWLVTLCRVLCSQTG